MFCQSVEILNQYIFYDMTDVAPKEKTYELEYWIDSNEFLSKDSLKNYLVDKLRKRYSKLHSHEIKKRGKYFVLRFSSSKEVIDYCYEALDFNRDRCFRVKDDLGIALRLDAYPVLAEIELSLRSFIAKAIINVMGFDWWNFYIKEDIRAKVKNIENSIAGYKKSQVNCFHPIELTFFDDLIEIVTHEFQDWSLEEEIQVYHLLDLFSICNSFEDIKREIEKRTKTVSFWDDIFSGYFDNKELWGELKEKILKSVIPIRNKVMHHRLIRCYEVEEVKKIRDEVEQVLNLAKPEIPEEDLERIKSDVKVIGKFLPPIDFESVNKTFQETASNPEIWKKMNQFLSPETLKTVSKTVQKFQVPQVKLQLEALKTISNQEKAFKKIASQIGEGQFEELENEESIPDSSEDSLDEEE
jgi:hypothetical protein